MVIPGFGRVSLGPTGSEVIFTADPTTLEITQPKRTSNHRGLGGVVTIQDFARRIKDATVRLEGDIMDDDVVRSLLGFYDLQGATLHYKDWVENDLTVFFEEFAPVSYPWRAQSPTGASFGGASRYRLTLRVVSAAKLWNQAYGGL